MNSHSCMHNHCTLLCLHLGRCVLTLVGCLKQQSEHTCDSRCTASCSACFNYICVYARCCGNRLPVGVHVSQQIQSHECRSEIKGALEEVATASHQCSLLSQQHQGLLQRQQATLPDPDPLADQVCPSAPHLHAHRPACHRTRAAGIMYMMCGATDADQASAHT